MGKRKSMSDRGDSSAALSMSRFIHRKILIRLFLGWLFLSVSVGGVVLLLEIHSVEKLVHRLALKESENFSGESAHNLDKIDPGALEHLKQLAQQLVAQHFLIVELYDKTRQLKLEVVRGDNELSEQMIDPYRHKFPKEGEFFQQLHFIGDNLLLVTLVPLKDAQDKPIGYFEGVYQVDRETFASIKQDVLGTLTFVAIGISFTTLLMYPIILTLNRGLIKLSSDLLKGNLELMNVLGCAIAERDSDTNSHNYRVTLYALLLAEAIGLSREDIHDLIAGAFLHDVGKIGIRDLILLKSGNLTPEEFEVMKTHVSLGVDILSKSSWLRGALDVVEFHHEKYDGSGYLRGLKGEAIPLNARIFAIVDVFDALTSKRPYKEAWTPVDAIAVLKRDCGTHFDPKLVKVFTMIAPDIYQKINGIKEQQLEAMLQHRITRYFLTSDLGGGAKTPSRY
jgi:HD-GYP domain-containing protein (c-di-GMP phosphodiesterase class II)